MRATGKDCLARTAGDNHSRGLLATTTAEDCLQAVPQVLAQVLLSRTTGKDCWYEELVRTTGEDHWQGLLAKTTGEDRLQALPQILPQVLLGSY